MMGIRDWLEMGAYHTVVKLSPLGVTIVLFLPFDLEQIEELELVLRVGRSMSLLQVLGDDLELFTICRH